MGYVLAFAMQKGGVGKTTSALNIGAALAQRGARVLLVDLDPQANLTEGLGYDPQSIDLTVYEVLLNPQQGIHQETIETKFGLDLIPANKRLAGARGELQDKIGRELILRKALRQAREEYDYILIDPPPELGLFTLNALAAADAAIVPLELHVYAWKKMPELEETIMLVRDLNPSLDMGGIVCTKANSRTHLSQGIEERARARYGELVFKVTVPFNVRLAEAPAVGQPVHLYDPSSTGAKAYQAVTDELEERYAWR